MSRQNGQTRSSPLSSTILFSMQSSCDHLPHAQEMHSAPLPKHMQQSLLLMVMSTVMSLPRVFLICGLSAVVVSNFLHLALVQYQ